MNKTLYRSNTDRRVAGVCGGIGAYLNIDPTLIRVLWICFICMGGSGFLAYLICMIIIPLQPNIDD
jgi:phage shock protein PspC (stress-responsive transcriptional regulator)